MVSAGLGVILVAAPEVYDQALKLPPSWPRWTEVAFLMALSAFIALLTIGVLRGQEGSSPIRRLPRRLGRLVRENETAQDRPFPVRTVVPHGSGSENTLGRAGAAKHAIPSRNHGHERTPKPQVDMAAYW
jgi:hypothetical protein